MRTIADINFRTFGMMLLCLAMLVSALAGSAATASTMDHSAVVMTTAMSADLDGPSHCEPAEMDDCCQAGMCDNDCTSNTVSVAILSIHAPSSLVSAARHESVILALTDHFANAPNPPPII